MTPMKADMVPFHAEAIAVGDCAVLRITGDGRVLQLFTITGLRRAFELHPSVLDAISGDPHWQAALAGERPAAENHAAGNHFARDHGAGEWCRKHKLP